jgi:hypothetical protein
MHVIGTRRDSEAEPANGWNIIVMSTGRLLTPNSIMSMKSPPVLRRFPNSNPRVIFLTTAIKPKDLYRNIKSSGQIFRD